MTNEQALQQAKDQVKILISIIITYGNRLEDLKSDVYDPKQIDPTEFEIQKLISKIDKALNILI